MFAHRGSGVTAVHLSGGDVQATTDETGSSVEQPSSATGDGGQADGRDLRVVDLHFALAGGAVAAVAMFGGIAVVGRVTPYEGLDLLDAVLPTIRFLASSVMAAGATVLALMLTLLGITYTTRWKFRDAHYHRIGQISLLASISIVLAVVVLLFLGLPVGEADGLRLYHHIVYYGLTASASLLGGLTVAVVLMLHRTIRGLVAIGHSSAKSELIEAEERTGLHVESA